jgi:DNA-binding transcriptional LysR family regulator
MRGENALTVLQMKCFVSLVNTKKQADTASVLGIQSSTLSKYIEHMENEFSIKLFQKTTDGLELTKEGALLYPSIQFMLKKYEDMIQQLGAFTPKWPLKINIVSMFHQSQIIKITNDFLKNNPYIQVSILEKSVQEAQKALDAKSADAAIIYKELLPKKYLHTYTLQEVELVAVFNRKHPLAEREMISLSELKDESFILFKGDAPMYSFLLHTCISADFVPNEMSLDLRMYTILDYLRENKGVSLLMKNVVEGFPDDRLAVVSLKEKPKLTMSMVFPTDYPSQACEKMISFIREQYNGQG